MNCPQCHQPMEQGWLAIYEPIVITRVVWQPVEPGYVRLKAPEGSVKIIQPRMGGGGSPEAFLCRACEVTVCAYGKALE